MCGLHAKEGCYLVELLTGEAHDPLHDLAEVGLRERGSVSVHINWPWVKRMEWAWRAAPWRESTASTAKNCRLPAVLVVLDRVADEAPGAEKERENGLQEG